MPKLFVQVQTRFSALHQWKDAPERVSFLRNLHRHEFHVRLRIQVNHEDRNIEFLMLKQDLEFLLQSYKDRVIGSCETFARMVYATFKELYPNNLIEVEVSEDGENSGICTDI